MSAQCLHAAVSDMKRFMTIFTLRCSEAGCSQLAVGSSDVEARSKMSSHLLLKHGQLVGFGRLPEPIQERVEVSTVLRRVGRPEPSGQVMLPF